ncbi:hypothetical protein DIU31_027365 [Mucilaginibacter rubeus]|jgi:hypothetical protein|uniref:DUF2946 domain-containing protein n=1 Tax=Mucilaginibacter rubeus TaxID=2027860 RepID=A0AAE6JK36_9SPHI|nr:MULTISPECIES: hypothetical protein [Mucilaginibacter]NHA05639.1 hypothetical protein [Mucilaginibacter inviolabilis]QEM07045.1 hypothetical protein DIU31_027365 [Mucilaginibacter rubeus]QTE35443.1 hypothetical protein J3L18_20120 [Mucilaginibacter gossypii]QTE43813.1 hypothetical protein J3L19_00060 [Mucilaginibacter rubeus]QTE50413.1 hypothetical protein J3L21_00040 [Mucilaginibacter rubeus]
MKSKALFLLTVFLLNAVAGFSCALHMNVEGTGKSVLHEDGLHAAHHDHMKMMSLQQPKSDGPQFESKADPCCQGMSNNFAALAKLVPQPEKVHIQIPFISAGLYYDYRFVPVYDLDIASNYLIPQKRPPTRGIRLIIRSFQI